MNNDKLKHLEFIQNVINRMGYNSFLVKGWCITILAAFLAITANTGENRFVLLSFFPLICFWLLDSYYLQQERKFRQHKINGFRSEFSKYSEKNLHDIEVWHFKVANNRIFYSNKSKHK